MKKKVKYIIIGAVALLIVGAIVVSAMQPLAVDTLVVTQSRAELYFT